MTDVPAPDPVEDDPAAVGFGLLMAGVEGAVAAAAEEIASLGQLMRQGLKELPTLTPPALPPSSARLPAASNAEHSPEAAPDDAAPAAAIEPLPRDTSNRPLVNGEANASIAPASQVTSAAQSPVVLSSSPAPAVEPAIPPQVSAPLATSHSERLPPATELAATIAPALPPAAASPASAVQSLAPAAAPGAPRADQVPTLPDAGPVAVEPAPRLPPPVAPSVRASPAMADPSTWVPAFRTTLASGSEHRAKVDGSEIPVAPSTSPARSVAPRRHEAGPEATTAGASGPAQGDVFLDGARVGHWLGEMLARAAGGPARGSTGFDSRMGPRWPGTLQGR